MFVLTETIKTMDPSILLAGAAVAFTFLFLVRKPLLGMVRHLNSSQPLDEPIMNENAGQPELDFFPNLVPGKQAGRGKGFTFVRPIF